MKPKTENRGGPGRGQGRKPLPWDKKKHTKSVCLSLAAWERIELRAAATGLSRSEVVERWLSQPFPKP